MIKTHSRCHQVLNRILNLAEGWVPLTAPYCHPPLSLGESGFGEGVAFAIAKSGSLRGFVVLKGCGGGKPKILLVRTTSTTTTHCSHHQPQRTRARIPFTKGLSGRLIYRTF